jgi:transcription initiation factor TFIID subunit 7
MLVVEDKILPGAEAHQGKSFNVDELVWPHGVTPPLHWARKRRFRKRLNRRVRLIQFCLVVGLMKTFRRLKLWKKKWSDSSPKMLLRTEWRMVISSTLIVSLTQLILTLDVLENVNPDLSDSEFIDREETTLEFGTPMPGDSEAGDAPTPATQRLEAAEEQEGETDPEAEGDFDEELAAELDLALGSQGSSEGESDEENEEGERDVEGSADEGDEDDEEDEDDEIDTAEAKRARKLLNEEIRDLEAAVNKKSLEIERSLNPLIRVCLISLLHLHHLMTFATLATVRGGSA